jgi:tetratricopeptide (TPR) repeat protein
VPRGIEWFAHAVPNTSFCSDGRIARASFMVEADRARFASSLGIPATAMALVDKRTCSTDAAWLACGRYAGVAAVWILGEPPEPLVVPIGWSPAELAFHSPEEMGHLEYLGREKNVDVYRDRRTGQKLYAGRTGPSLDPAEAKRLEALRTEARALVSPSILGQGALGFFEKRRLSKGVALYEQIIAAVPDHWQSHWTIGMCRRRLGEEEAALASFRRAYELEKQNPDVGRECAGQCFRLGLGEEGLRISRELHDRFPADVGLHSNLALALLIGGSLDEALEVGRAALAREPNDAVTKNLVDYIAKVAAGQVPRPTRLPGM